MVNQRSISFFFSLFHSFATHHPTLRAGVDMAAGRVCVCGRASERECKSERERSEAREKKLAALLLEQNVERSKKKKKKTQPRPPRFSTSPAQPVFLSQRRKMLSNRPIRVGKKRGRESNSPCLFELLQASANKKKRERGKKLNLHLSTSISRPPLLPIITHTPMFTQVFTRPSGTTGSPLTCTAPSPPASAAPRTEKKHRRPSSSPSPSAPLPLHFLHFHFHLLPTTLL